jgi:hypothetical protein
MHRLITKKNLQEANQKKAKTRVLLTLRKEKMS